MNWASWCSVRCLSVNHTVMKSFSSPLKRRYQRNDAVRSVTSWRSAATRRPVRRQLARGPGVDAGDGRRHLLVLGEIDDRHGAGGERGPGAQLHSTRRPAASSSCSSTSVRAAARQV